MAVKNVLRTIGRLGRLLLLYAYMDLMWMARDIRYFLTCYISDVFLSIAAVTSALLLAERFNGIGSWSKFEVLFLLGYVTTVKGIAESLFGYNILHISRRLGRGQFDHTLIQPQPVWMSLLTEGFSPFSGSALLFPGIALMSWSIVSLKVGVSSGWFTLLLLNLGASALVIAAFSYIWGSLAFWAPRAAEELSTPAVEMTKQLSIAAHSRLYQGSQP